MENVGHNEPITLSYSGNRVRKCAVAAKAHYYSIQSQIQETEDRITAMEWKKSFVG